jgi:hypothetical protein
MSRFEMFRRVMCPNDAKSGEFSFGSASVQLPRQDPLSRYANLSLAWRLDVSEQVNRLVHKREESLRRSRRGNRHQRCHCHVKRHKHRKLSLQDTPASVQVPRALQLDSSHSRWKELEYPCRKIHYCTACSDGSTYRSRLTHCCNSRLRLYVQSASHQTLLLDQQTDSILDKSLFNSMRTAALARCPAGRPPHPLRLWRRHKMHSLHSGCSTHRI